MKLFACGTCHNLIYFENDTCLHCGSSLGFDSEKLWLVTLQGGQQGTGAKDPAPGSGFRYCRNAQYGTCNWLVPDGEEDPFCVACRLNRTIPFLGTAENEERWKNIESAKHRLVYSLLRLGLPVEKKMGEEEKGIAFDFLADSSHKERVLTGHDNGVITLNIEEADEAKRVKNKQDLGERYRTLLGHFRHEIGHYYWNILIEKNPDRLAAYRAEFGNEEQDYGEALKSYYRTGAPENWSEFFISPYASSHPWEDWAESWAHYLHLMDTLETAFAFGIRVEAGKIPDARRLQAAIEQDPYSTADFQSIVEWWFPLSFAVNSLNRSMGHSDFYPFVISGPIVKKLRFIHDLCRSVSVNTVE